jgi:predicted nucleic acid-binding protein
MSNLLVDTGPLIRHLRGEQPTVQLLRITAQSGRMVISAITRAEVRSRMHPEERYATQKLLSRFNTLALDREIADRAGDLRNTFRLQGLTIGLADAVIAATAIAHNLTLLTYNRADFEFIPGLRL